MGHAGDLIYLVVGYSNYPRGTHSEVRTRFWNVSAHCSPRRPSGAPVSTTVPTLDGDANRLKDDTGKSRLLRAFTSSIPTASVLPTIATFSFRFTGWGPPSGSAAEEAVPPVAAAAAAAVVAANPKAAARWWWW